MLKLSVSKARARVENAIATQLSSIAAAASLAEMSAKAVEAFDAAVLSQSIMERLLGDPDTVQGLRVLVADEKAPQEKEWITSQEAATRMGFSRPYVVALLDSAEFEGKVLKRAGGHRRVLASSVAEWMNQHGVRHPPSAQDVAKLEAPDDPAFFEEFPEPSESEPVERLANILAGRKASLKHRP